MTAKRSTVLRIVVSVLCALVCLAGAAAALLNWSVSRSYNATAALLQSNMISASQKDPDISALQRSQSQVDEQLASEASTSSFQAQRVRNAIRSAQQASKSLDAKLTAIQKKNEEATEQNAKQASAAAPSPSSSASSPSSSSQPTDAARNQAIQEAQERTQESQDQTKLDSLLGQNTVNDSSTADGTAASPTHAAAPQPW
ncbi:MAG: hypothetical protein IJV49_02925 [Aeriscardovia sp.]|nr:hypothetical protein [Aeriscardovia sp.]